MVTSTRSADQLTIVARPNHSATWRTNLYLLIGLAVPSLGAAIGFTLVGAWPVLAFAALELIALGLALYRVNWKLQYRHVITLSEDRIAIEKGHHYPRQSWQFARRGSGLCVTPEAHPLSSPALSLHDDRESVRVGEFLNREEALSLLSLLRQEVRVDSYSEYQRRRF